MVRLAAASSARSELTRPTGVAGRRPGGAEKPRVLFVVATEEGGTPHTNADLMAALGDRYDCFLLHSDSQLLTLSRVRGRRAERLRQVRLPKPIRPMPHTDADYDAIIAAWLAEQAIDLVHIRHLAWHSLSLPRLARQAGSAVVFSVHDYYAVCPTVRLIDENGRYCAGDCTSDLGTCRHVLWPKTAAPALRHSQVHRWRAMMAAALGDCHALVTTCEPARSLVLRHLPTLAEKPFAIIPHGRDFPRFASLGRFPEAGERVRILVAGNLTASKGAAVIRAIGEANDGRFEFHLIGPRTRALRGAAGVIAHGPYARESFVDVAEAIRPHFGAVLSIWPETWCHTLTEMWAAGLPVLGFDLGAVGERLRRHGGGWPISPGGARDALAALERIAGDRTDFAGKLDEVSAWQRTIGRAQTCAAMADEYARLYRSLPRGTQRALGLAP
jgi:glycosyltransferase involved in cell wall biosynthesis